MQVSTIPEIKFADIDFNDGDSYDITEMKYMAKGMEIFNEVSDRCLIIFVDKHGMSYEETFDYWQHPESKLYFVMLVDGSDTEENTLILRTTETMRHGHKTSYTVKPLTLHEANDYSDDLVVARYGRIFSPQRFFHRFD